MLPTNADLRYQVARLSRQISAQERRLQEMRAQLHPLQLRLDALTYPVLTLPLEITSEIFLHCLPVVHSGVDGISTSEAPLLLLRICRQWRRIALSTPALWSRLGIDVPRRENHATDIVDTWLGRAGQCPLSVTVKGPIKYTEIDDSDLFFETLCRHAPTIRSLELEFDLDDWEILPQRVNFSALTELTLRLFQFDRVVDECPSDPVEMFNDVQGLHRLFLSQIRCRLVVLPWQQLRSFTGQLYDIFECMEALSLMPHLTECAFSMFLDEGGFEGDEAQVFSHPGIRSFTLFRTLSDTEYLAQSAELLEFVTFPNLESLQLLDVDHYDHEILHSFLERSSPPLKRLVVHPGDDQGPTDLALTTQALHAHLTELEIWYPDKSLASLFFNSLGADASFLPRLQELSLHCQGRRAEASVGGLVGLAAGALAKRGSLPGAAQLRKFRLIAMGTFYAMLSQAEMAPFRRLKIQGMDVFIGRGRNNCLFDTAQSGNILV
ncbi:hypothetical protein FB45DRAFT_425045 [Roridomyces roridus]|uniref:F-box domain-containing protein n=1 Tax=Roridomyces roridus TaxID=1738132 RepID=A0AAD7C5S4_9AGAR|nr:hypothetical protein FB45DRAFT_425045 [Roridomyces roridus]